MKKITKSCSVLIWKSVHQLYWFWFVSLKTYNIEHRLNDKIWVYDVCVNSMTQVWGGFQFVTIRRWLHILFQFLMINIRLYRITTSCKLLKHTSSSISLFTESDMNIEFDTKEALIWGSLVDRRISVINIFQQAMLATECQILGNPVPSFPWIFIQNFVISVVLIILSIPRCF